MSPKQDTWVLVLAAGEGERVRSLTRDRSGLPAPKQFSLVDGDRTLLAAAVARAGKMAPVERIIAIVASHHRRWWSTELAELPPENVVVQPRNRGTAAGILLPLFRIRQRDELATVVIVPSDHYVKDEETLHSASADAIAALRSSRKGLVLLGVAPEEPDSQYGWIVPSCETGERSLSGVSRFVEKPDPETAECLLGQGGLLNSFVLVVELRALLAMYKNRLPELWRLFEHTLCGGTLRSGSEATSVTEIYRQIPRLDFSRELLEKASADLDVYRVPECGWTDLGTPDRLVRHQAEFSG